jgi:hypothetical protein
MGSTPTSVLANNPSLKKAIQHNERAVVSVDQVLLHQCFGGALRA